MRTTTLPEMLKVLVTNYNRKVEEAKLFEIIICVSAKSCR